MKLKRRVSITRVGLPLLLAASIMASGPIAQSAERIYIR